MFQKFDSKLFAESFLPVKKIEFQDSLISKMLLTIS